MPGSHGAEGRTRRAAASLFVGVHAGEPLEQLRRVLLEVIAALRGEPRALERSLELAAALRARPDVEADLDAAMALHELGRAELAWETLDRVAAPPARRAPRRPARAGAAGAAPARRGRSRGGRTAPRSRQAVHARLVDPARARRDTGSAASVRRRWRRTGRAVDPSVLHPGPGPDEFPLSRLRLSGPQQPSVARGPALADDRRMTRPFSCLAALALAACSGPAAEVDAGSTPADAPAPPPVDAPPGDSPRDDAATGDGVLFASDFGTALGMEDPAVMDQARTPTWCLRGGAVDGLEVVDGATAGFPTPGALRVIARLERSGSMIRIGSPWCTGMPIPAIGESRYYRWYYRHDQPDHPPDNRQHPIQDGNAISQTSWAFDTISLSDTTWEHDYSVQSNSGENPFELQRWLSPVLQQGVVYRFELHILRTGDTTFEMHARTYDAAGTLLYDDDDYRNAPGTMTLADRPTLHFHATSGASTLDGLNAGVNGISDITEDTPYAHQTGFCVRSDRWCGPYADGI
jgi:hypothetical protein